MANSKQAFANFVRLRMVADLVLEEPQCLLPPWTDHGATHYSSRIVLSDKPRTPRDGVLEARIVYEQDSAYDPRDKYAAICRITWDIGADWGRCQSRSVVRPTISNECFRVDRNGLIEINRAMRALAKRCGPVEFDELTLDQLPELTGPFRIARQTARTRRVNFGANASRVDVTFHSKWFDKPFNQAWERVWRVLGSMMIKRNSFGPGKFASHGITPNQYARLLAQEATI